MTGWAVRDVDADGVVLDRAPPDVLDLRFDGRRVCSVLPSRDARRADRGWRIPWPTALLPFLTGSTRLEIVEHLSGVVGHAAEIRFDQAKSRVAVEDPQGRPLGVDKWGHLARLFDSGAPGAVDILLEAAAAVLATLQSADVAAFIAYGTLLGAVREGRLLGHDSDVDLGYISALTTPVDVTTESYRVEAVVRAAGWTTHRYSGLSFRIDVVEPDGTVRGLDVFGGFYRAGLVYLLGEVGAPLREDQIWPLTTRRLEGRAFATPADPEALLAATYGEGWAIPDPAFAYEGHRPTRRRLTGWFRGNRRHRGRWEMVHTAQSLGAVESGPTDLARLVADREPALTQVVDLGCGRGGDVLWFARRGVTAWGFDHSTVGPLAARDLAAQDGLDAEFGELQLGELRSGLLLAARLSRCEGVRAITARWLVNALSPTYRARLWRLCSLSSRSGGRTYLEVIDEATDAAALAAHTGAATADLLEPMAAASLQTEIERARGHVEELRTGTVDGVTTSRLIVTW